MNLQRLVPLTLLLCFGVSGSVLLASVPDPNGVIHACVSKSGHLRVIDTATEKCKKHETPLSWSAESTGTSNSDPSVFDSTGHYVGSLVPGENGFDNDRVTLRLSTGDVLVPAVRQDAIFVREGGPEIWFPTTDCSGQGYIEGGNGLTKRIWLLPGRIVYPGGQGPFPTITMNSRHRFSSDGSEIEPCQAIVATDVNSGPYTEFDTTVFVPPFHIE